MTQRFDFFWIDSKNRTLLNVTQRIEPLFLTWFKELNPLHKWTPRIDFFHFWFFSHFFSKIWTLFNMIHRIEPFLNNMTHWDWTLLFNMSQRKWLILSMTQRFSSFAKCMTQRMNWSFLENMTLRIEIFERKTDSKNWTFSKIDSMDWTFCFTWPKELNFFPI